MYYRIASFQIDPQYESEFLDAANSFRKEIKTTKEPPFIDFVKTSDTKAMSVITYESENSVVKTDDDFRRMWTKLQRSKFVKGSLTISEGLVSWML